MSINDDDDREPYLHPRVLQAIDEGRRDLPLTLSWSPHDPHAFDFLGLPRLRFAGAREASVHVLTEALAAGGGKYISYSRHREFYSKASRYCGRFYSYSSIVPAIDVLAAAGVIEHEKMRPGHRGMQSRFRATPQLIAETHKIPIIYRPMEIIVLRDEEGNAIDYRDNRKTRAMRARLEGLNEGLLAQRIEFNGRIIREGDLLDNGGRAQVQLNRIFHRGNFEYGGRFYGGHWQNVGDRVARYQMEGEPVSEVDYVAMHIAMLYGEVGKQMPRDPYEIDGWPRQQVKVATLIGINARTKASAIRALADVLRNMDNALSYPFPRAEALLKAVKAKHAPIEHAFGSDAGVRLMRRDSDLAEKVMTQMVRATGIVPLVVHDSFIVPVTKEQSLQEIMEKVAGCRTKISGIPGGMSGSFYGGTSPKMEHPLC
jgi:hypothetical protein